MDLLQTVRKEGSRGGRANFSWDDVKGDQHRENYLGHSLMAPVGRWQKGRDLNWYANADEKDAVSEADARRDEIRKVKEAEDEAMARALGIELPSSTGAPGGANANMVALGPRAEERREHRARDERGDRADRRDREERRHRHRHHHRHRRSRSRSRSRERSPRRRRDDRSRSRSRSREDRRRDERYRERRRERDGDGRRYDERDRPSRR